MKVEEPKTQEDFNSYYNLRYEVLRKPWNQPEGSERDDLEGSCIHAMIRNTQGEVIAAGRLQFNSGNEAQVRFMAVRSNSHRKGFGAQILNYLEKKSLDNGRKKVVLQARENAVPFYLNQGYKIKEKSFLLWGQIQHYLMEKDI